MRSTYHRETAIAAAMLVSAASAASAQTVNGGGSSLAGPTYQAAFSAYNVNNPSAPVSFSYYIIGSGAAQSAFVNQTPSTFALPAGSTVHFAASDATISAGLLSTWNSTRAATAGSLVQVATFGTPITAAFNAITNGSGGNISSLSLTEAKVCGIFSGRINDVSTLVSGVPTGTTLNVVYRSDNSGTTFLLTQHLNAVCGTPTSTGLTGQTEPVTFTATQNFASLFGGTAPTNFTGASGSGGVKAAVIGASNVIGYLSPDYTQIAPVHTGDTSFPLVASVTNLNNSTSYAPNYTNANTALNTSTAGGVPVVANPSVGYPIVGYTTWDLASCYSNGGVVSQIQAFLNSLYNDYLDSTLNANGFAAASTAVQNSGLDAVGAIAQGGTGACSSLAGL